MKPLALISGSSHGVGKGIAQVLALDGYEVIITGRGQQRVEQTVQDIKQAGGTAHAVVGDLTTAVGVGSALNLLGRPYDLLVANLGSGKSQPGWEISLEEHRRVFDLNFFSAVELATQGAKQMREGSAIVFISSIAGCENLGAPIAYTAAKTALLSYAKSLSTHLAPKGIRVNTVSPGNVLFAGGSWDEKLQKDRAGVLNMIKENVALNDFATPEDIGQAVLFLAQARFVTGTNLVVDGGQLQKII